MTSKLDPSSPKSIEPQNFGTEFMCDILDAVSDPVFVKNANHQWVYMNQAFCDFVGFPKNDLLGASDYDFFPKEQADVFWEKDNQVFSSGKSDTNIEHITRSDRQKLTISTHKSILIDQNGRRFLLGKIKDITENTVREKHHKQIASILKKIVLNTPENDVLTAILTAAKDTLSNVIPTILHLDQATQRLHPALDSALPEEFTKAIDGTPAKSGMGSCGEAAYLKKTVVIDDIVSHPNWAKVRNLAIKYDLRACWSQPIYNFKGNVIGTFAMYFNHIAKPTPFDKEVLIALSQLTTIALEHHRIEKETENIKSLMTNVINAMPSMLLTVGCGGKILLWNTEAEKMTGISASEAIGKELNEVLNLNATQLTRINDAIKNRKTLNWTRVSHPWKGEAHWLDLTLYPIGCEKGSGSVIRIDDVTRQVRLAEMMIQAEKINSLGGLTAGMAHEINNPLAGILQNVQILENRLLKNLPQNIKTAETCNIDFKLIETYMQQRKISGVINSIQQAGSRASDIVNNMLNFSRKSETNKNFTNLPKLMENTISLLKTDYNHAQKYDFRDIKITRNYQAGFPDVFCTSSDMQQVFFNLLKNAAQAMAEGENPYIDISIKTQKGSALISIKDNGPGISSDLQKHIFEPFYTTKPVGAGTGLGLSVAYFIVTELNQGYLHLESHPGKGAKFTIELPLKTPDK